MLSTRLAFSIAVAWSCDAFVPPPPCSPTSGCSNTKRPLRRTLVKRSSSTNVITEIITDNTLPRMISFFALDMVDSTTDRFYYICRPSDGEREHVHMPIRDLAAAWDATKALLFLETQSYYMYDGKRDFNDKTDTTEFVRQNLRAAVCSTLEAYQPLAPMAEAGTECADQHRPALTLDASLLQETANIAHSALLIMATANACRLTICPDSDVDKNISGLLQGILSRQRSDGAFRIEFMSNNGQSDRDDVYKGIDFFPGEAMLALMDVYDLSEELGDVADEALRESIVSSMERAYIFYCDYYHQERPDVNFNIWQITSLSRFYDVLGRRGRSDQATFVAQHVLQMCRDIVHSRAWKELKQGQRFYANLNTVEIFCGLDAIAEGIRLASAIGDDNTAALLKRNAMNAVYFVEWSQSQVSKDSPVGYGGLGFGGTHVIEQRLDVTGHALSALVKLCLVL